MAKFWRFEGAFSWFFIELETHTVERDICLIATAQRPKCSYNNGYIAYFYCACAKRPYFRFRFEEVSVDFFIGKAESPPYFYFRFIWPTDLESVPRVEPPTLIISVKFEVDSTGHRRVTALLVRIRYLTLWPWPLWNLFLGLPVPVMAVVIVY